MKRKTEVTDFHDRDSSAWKKFILLVWKNYIIQKRHNIQTIVEITLPLLFTCLLLVIRVVIKLDVVTEPTIFPAFPVEIDSLEDLNFTCENEALFGFKPCLVAFTPNTSEIIELMGEVGSKLDVTAKGYQSEADMISELMGTTSSKKSSSNKSPRKPSSPRDATARSFGDGVCDPLGNNTDIFQDLLENFVTNRTIQGSFRAGVVFNVTSFSNQTHIQAISFPVSPRVCLPAHPPTISLLFASDVAEIPSRPVPEEQSFDADSHMDDRPPLSQVSDAGAPYRVQGGISLPGYYEEGFLLLQHTIFKEIANFWNSAGLNSTEEQNSSWPSEDDLQVYLQRMPYPPYVDDTFLVALGGWLPLVLMLSFIYPAANISKSITHEKEKRLKESMKMMGLPNWQHWLAWFVKSFLFLLIAVILMTIILVVKAYKAPNGTKLAVLDKSDPFLVFCFLVTYALATIAFAFLVSTIFSKANSASTWSGLLWFLTYIPFTFLDPRYEQLSLNLKLSTSIFVNMAMAFAGKIIGLFEGAGKGVRWETLWEPVSPDDDLSFGHIMLMFLVDIVLYLLIAWYLDAVFPGSYGVPQKWYFPFQKSYWLGIKEKPIEEATSALRARPDLFEEDPRHLKPGIRIINLSKIYKGEKLAVNGMNLNMYEGQITVLLGHNGAGKTTTMSMLTDDDLLTPDRDAGRAHLRDGSVGEESHVGSAPGESKSPESKERRGRTMLLTTHFMDEADLLGDRIAIMSEGDLKCVGSSIFLKKKFVQDRIAIMSEGDLKCVGSSIFLKKKFGAGYHMVAVKEPWCDVSRVTEVIQRHVPDGSLDQNVGAELTFLLPDNSSPRFPSMFTELENRKGDLGISSFGVSVTTMEEVFIRWESVFVSRIARK
ncbi:unnamed protein product [Darwinula stevensoni]|uniref:ABC transporter domain-containing protein n=1 Tax=Darwinula stevensoni TaxID=69355 RepID=A0A7R9A890_9CRUS|nr:unnamed protein product [Darwinula stevensoni]CAG0896162.1 unnamed protein product [Darwinula stevensoni]